MRDFVNMRRLGMNPNEQTFPYVLKSCASVLGFTEGRQLHCDALKRGLCLNVYVKNSLVHLYGKCKNVMDAYKVFDETSCRTIVSWNSMISACAESSWFYACVHLYLKMLDNGFEPDETTMVIILNSCAEIGNLSMGKWIHAQVISHGLVLNCHLGTALVDMYSKCGYVKYASLVFNRMTYKNVWTWCSMIHGFAQHGFARQALDLFRDMRNQSIEPNHVVYLGILCACSHAGLVDDGRLYFNEMERVYKIKPTMLHYGAMVDILGRAGHIKEAYDFVTQMPIEPDGVVWRTLLSACSINDVNDFTGLGDKVKKRLVELEPKRSGNFAMLANRYARLGLWDEAAHLKSTTRRLKKVHGESCLEIGGTIFRFFSGDDSCVRSMDVLLLLNALDLHAKMMFE